MVDWLKRSRDENESFHGETRSWIFEAKWKVGRNKICTLARWTQRGCNYWNTWLRFDGRGVRPAASWNFRHSARPRHRQFESFAGAKVVAPFPLSPPTHHHRRTMNRATLFTSGFTRRRSRLFPGENRAVSSFHDPPSAPPPCCKTTVKYAPCSELTIPAVTIYEVTRVYEETRGEWGKRWNWKCFLSNVSADSDPRIDWIAKSENYRESTFECIGFFFLIIQIIKFNLSNTGSRIWK